MKTAAAGVLCLGVAALLAAATAGGAAPAPATSATPPVQTHAGKRLPNSGIERLDAALDRIVDRRTEIYQVNDDDTFGILEGPAWIPEGKAGHLLFSDVAANVIYKWTPATRQLSVFLEKSGFSGTPADALRLGFTTRRGPYTILIPGSVGIARDPQGRILVGAQGDRNVVRLDADGTRTVLADQYEGKPFERINKVIVKSNGTVYFSDLRRAVYMLRDGKVSRVLSIGHGIELSPDERYLYVSHENLRRYDVQPDDTLANEQVIQPGPPAGATPDGMAVDREGNIYGNGPGGLWITTPAGRHIGTIRLPEMVTNVAFGDPDLQTLYITNRRNLVKVRLRIAGMVLPERLSKPVN